MKGFNYKKYEKYVNSLNIATADFDIFLKQFLLEMAQRVVARAKQRTPVDTGALKNSWSIGNQRVELIETGGTSASGKQEVTIDTSKSDIASIAVIGNTLQVEIFNPMEYASYVELGHGTYQPRYMLTISINEVERQMPKRFESQFKQFLKSRGVG